MWFCPRRRIIEGTHELPKMSASTWCVTIINAADDALKVCRNMSSNIDAQRSGGLAAITLSASSTACTSVPFRHVVSSHDVHRSALIFFGSVDKRHQIAAGEWVHFAERRTKLISGGLFINPCG
jgi:hypothetical protein